MSVVIVTVSMFAAKVEIRKPRITMKPNESSLTDAFDMMSLKKQSLDFAAKMSPYIQGEATIGPDSCYKDVAEVLPPKSPVKSEAIDEDALWDSFRLNESACMDLNSSLDLQNVRSVICVNELEKLRKDVIKREMEKRLSRRVSNDFREKIARESELYLREKSQRMIEECEKRIKEALQEYELKEQRLAEEAQRKQELFEKKKSEVARFIKQQEDKKTIHKCLDSISSNQDQLKRHYETYMRLMSDLEVNLKNSITTVLGDKINSIFSTNDNVIRSIKSGKITETEVALSNQMIVDFQGIIGECNSLILADTKQKEETAAAAAALAQRERQQQQAAAVQTKPAPVTVKPRDLTDSSTAVLMNATQFISADSLKWYCQIENFYKMYSESVKPLMMDDTTKKFRFNCQKAINTPLNAISAVASAHLVDKYNKLAGLLAGANLPDQVNASSHPLGIQYCHLLMAKQFVNQASVMIASNAKSAFPMAAIIVALWHKFPDFGQLFLAHLFRDCPYLVPYFRPQLEGQSLDDYSLSIGYRFVDGARESQDMYLKRMCGIARLYAAIIISNPRRGDHHPYSLENGWKWLANVINMDPLPDICATLLVEFLTIAGSRMDRQYRKQFRKIINVVRGPYLQKLSQVDEGGPKARLEVLLSDFYKNGGFAEPDGALHPNFW